MTLHKSLNKSFRYTFFSAIKRFFYIPLIGMAILTFSISVTTYDYLKELVRNYKAESTPGNVLKISDFYKYMIFPNDDIGYYLDLVIRVGIVILCVILAVMLFRFITSKKTVNVYFSLGITRKNLFMSTFLAGIVMLFVAILVPFMSAAIINTSIIGSSRELWLTTIYYIMNYFVLALVCFGITAVVISVVGTVAEGIAFSGTVIAFISIFFSLLKVLFNIFIFGSPFSNFNYDGRPSLHLKYQAFNPVLFGRSSAASIGFLNREDINSKFMWTAPDFKLVIIWLIIAVAIFFFAMYLFQKRKVEISGFTGKSKALNNIVIFAIGFSLFCLALNIFSNYMDGKQSIIYGALTGAVVFMIVYAIILLILTRSFKQMLSELKMLGLHYSILAVITVAFSLGFFGYASRVPEIKDIKSVSIGGIIPNSVVDLGDIGFSGDEINFYYVYYVNAFGLDSKKVFTTENDFKIITELHDSIISDGKQVISNDRSLPMEKQVKGVSFKIEYTLNNGRKLERFYPAMKLTTIDNLLSLENTDYYRNYIKSALTEDVNQNDSHDMKYTKEFFQGESGQISLISNDLSTESILKLNAGMKKRLLNALSKDLVSLTPEQKLKPKSDALGNLIVSGLYSGIKYADDYYQVEPEEIIREGLIEENDVAKTYSLKSTMSNKEVCWIQITEDMKNTIDFLKANNMYSLLEGRGEYVSAQVISSIASPKNALNRYDYYSSGESNLFNASKHLAQKEEDSYFVDNFKNSVNISDSSIIEQLINDSYSYYYNGEGYYVRFSDKDESQTILFVPAEKMPQSIASSVANLPDADLNSFYPNDFMVYY